MGAIAMTTLFDSAAPVKSDRPFGILSRGDRRMPYTQADLDWAAQTFGELEDERQLEERALQAQWDDQFVGTLPATGHCLLCRDRCDDLTPQACTTAAMTRRTRPQSRARTPAPGWATACSEDPPEGHGCPVTFEATDDS
jgi:hypothetical protein